MKLLSSVKIDNLHENQIRLDSQHLLSQRCTLDDRDVLERLIRLNQKYKVNLTHALNMGRKDFNPLHQLNTIDYTQPWTLYDSSFDVEMSFTWLDWRIINKVIDPRINVHFGDIDEEQQLQLCFNILPNGRSMMHNLAIEASSKIASSAAFTLFQLAEKHQDLEITGADEGCHFEVPILPDVFGKTPLDICLGLEKVPDS